MVEINGPVGTEPMETLTHGCDVTPEGPRRQPMAEGTRCLFSQRVYKTVNVTLFLTMVPPLKYDETRYSRILQDLGENKKSSKSLPNF